MTSPEKDDTEVLREVNEEVLRDIVFSDNSRTLERFEKEWTTEIDQALSGIS